MLKIFTILFSFFITMNAKSDIMNSLENSSNPNQVVDNAFMTRNPETGEIKRYDAGVSKLFLLATSDDKVEDLIEKGADINFESVVGTTPLMWVSFLNPDGEDIVEELIENGAKLNHQNYFGRTALMEALSSYKSEDVVEELIDAGADVNLKDNQGNTALIIASSFISPELINDENRMEVMNYLSSRGEKDIEKTFSMDKDLLKLFLENSMSYDEEIKNASTNPEFKEKQEDLEDVIEDLLEAKTDIKIKNKFGKTAYDYAKENPYLKDSDILKKLQVKP